MSAIYAETSSVLAWLLGESAADEARATIDAAEPVLTSALTIAETERILVRAEAQGRLRGADVQRLRGMLERACASWVVMEVSGEILSRVGGAFPVEPVRTLDAVHLATALAFTRAFPELRVFSLDRRVLDNAEALGL